MFVFQTSAMQKAREAQAAFGTRQLNAQESQYLLNNGGKQAVAQMYKGMGLL
jgi:hypothetical protein